jgi:hypothetical protein
MDSSFKDFFTSIFVEESPKVLLKNYNVKLLKSLKSLFNSAEKTLKIDLSEQKAFVSKIEADRGLAQELHAYHAFLQEAVAKGSVKSVLQCLQKIGCSFREGQIYSDPFVIRTFSSDDWEQLVLNDLQELNRNMQGELPSFTPANMAEIQSVSCFIEETLELLRQVSPLFYEEFRMYVANLKLFHSDWLVGMTDVRVFGSIYLALPIGNMPMNVYFCEHIIHETSHLHLHTLFAIDKIVLNSPNERYTAPIRPDPRPMYGIFHATFVLSRMTRLFMLLAKDPVFEEYFELFLKRFVNGYNTVKKFGKLTPLGEKIVESYSDILSLEPAGCV